LAHRKAAHVSNLALQLIAENKKTRMPFLDLGNCGLTELPAEIAELFWLESLSLANEWREWDGQHWHERKSQNNGDKNYGNIDITPLAGLSRMRSLIVSRTQIADLAPLKGLTALQTLDISRTFVNDLSPLARVAALQTLCADETQVTNLAPLAGLCGLQTLFVSHTSVADLSLLAGLTALRTLDVSGTSVADLSPLARLSALETLRVAETRVADLSPLAGLTTLRTLGASGAEVSDLAPLAGLAALQTLLVSYTQVSDLAPLATLTTLQTLRLRETQVADLAPLAGLTALQALDISHTQVGDLAPLAGLAALQTLRVGDTQLADLSSLTGLTALQTLDVSNTRIADLAPLAGSTTLQALDISHTQVGDLAPLAGLAALQTLRVRDTQLADLSSLTGLTALETLDVSNTLVADLTPLRSWISHGRPVLWTSKRGEGPGIYVEGCPLINPPAEIVNQGIDAILNYFREREIGDVDHLYEAKMLILGEGGAGKTSLLRRLYRPDLPLPTERETTKGISIHRHEFQLKNGRGFRINVWDFGGQEIYHATHQFFLTRRSLYLLVDDTRKDYKSVSDEGFRYWLELIDLFGGHSPVLIFQNEKGDRSKPIDLAGIKGQYDNVKDLYAGNLEHASAVDQLRDGIEFYASNLSHIGEQLPVHWIKVRTDIETRASEVPHITQHEYFDIYRRHMEFSQSKALHLSRYLHDLGVFLHFQDDSLLARIVILQNSWVTEAVFRILDDETVKAQLGRFDSVDCERLWRDSVYVDMQPELLALMQRFELCYLLADSKPQTWLAPQLLPPAKPAALSDWGNRKSEDLVLRYRYGFMPKGIISRLTVRLHRFVQNPEMAWVTGVLFERDATAMLVGVLASGSEIELRVRGPERKALLSVVAADLDALNESFQGLRDKVDKRIPCNCRRCRVASIPEFFTQKQLLKRKEDKRLKVECQSSYEEVDVLGLLDGIRADELPGWAKEEDSLTSPRTIRIFLASSSELADDRDKFDLYFRQLNDQFLKKGLYLEINRWENFLDAMSETRLQDEYNEAVRACDIFVSLFFRKTGKFTEEEFDTAYRQFKSTGRPRICTFFKNAEVPMGTIGDEVMSLLQFKKKLQDLGHFCTNYDNIEHLKRQFRDQLDRLLE
jgi:internalin A